MSEEKPSAKVDEGFRYNSEEKEFKRKLDRLEDKIADLWLREPTFNTPLSQVYRDEIIDTIHEHFDELYDEATGNISNSDFLANFIPELDDKINSIFIKAVEAGVFDESVNIYNQEDLEDLEQEVEDLILKWLNQLTPYMDFREFKPDTIIDYHGVDIEEKIDDLFELFDQMFAPKYTKSKMNKYSSIRIGKFTNEVLNRLSEKVVNFQDVLDYTRTGLNKIFNVPKSNRLSQRFDAKVVDQIKQNFSEILAFASHNESEEENPKLN